MPEESAISALLDAVAASGDEHAVIDQDGDTRKISLTDLVEGGMEYGSTPDGEYVRIGNFQVCWVRNLGATTNASGNFFWTYPKPFVSVEAHSWTASTESSTYVFREILESSSAEALRLNTQYMDGSGGVGNATVSFNGLAAGRWK